MSEKEDPKVENGDSVQDTSAETKKPEEHMIPKSRLDEVIQKLDDAEKRAKALEKAAQDASRKRLKESEDFKTLYGDAEKELLTLRPKAEKAEDLENTLKASLEARIAEIPEDKRSLIPEELPPIAQQRWMDRNRDLLSKSQPMNIGAGIRGGTEQENSVTLSQEQRDAAKKMGVPFEGYSKSIDKQKDP